MIGMRMRIEYPLKLQIMFRNVSEDSVGALGPCRTRAFVEVENGIDDGAAIRLRTVQDVLDRARSGLMKGLNVGGQRR